MHRDTEYLEWGRQEDTYYVESPAPHCEECLDEGTMLCLTCTGEGCQDCGYRGVEPCSFC